MHEVVFSLYNSTKLLEIVDLLSGYLRCWIQYTFLLVTKVLLLCIKCPEIVDTWNWNDRFTLIVLTVLTTGERFKRRNLLIFVAFKIQLIVINLSINFDFILLISISLITYFCFRILINLPRCFILEAIFNISCLSRWQIRFRNTCERLRHHDLG